MDLNRSRTPAAQVILCLDQLLSLVPDAKPSDLMMPNTVSSPEVGPVGPVQPVVALGRVEDHRHSVMDRRDGVIRRPGQDRAGAQIVPD